jgi:hypothetical protein
MRGLRRAIIATGLAALGLVALGLVDCAAPTQIVVEVYSDACPGSGKTQTINSTGITVGKSADIETKPPAAFRDNCEAPPSGGVGTLVIYPSGANDDEVAIKVVAGVDIQADACRTPDYAGCIVHRRVVRFVPNTTQRLTVRLSLACLNRVCAPGATCDNGVCKAEADLLPDGGTKADAETKEAGLAEGGIVPADAGGPDACAGCKGTCTPAGCVVDCKNRVCDGTEQCSPTLPCNIACDGTGHCNDIHCTTSQKCTVTCGSPKASCNNVTCNAGECAVTCSGNESCNGDGGIALDAGTKGSLVCNGDNACRSASCNSPDCVLTCSPSNGMKNACPAPAPCTGGCDDWNTPN